MFADQVHVNGKKASLCPDNRETMARNLTLTEWRICILKLCQLYHSSNDQTWQTTIQKAHSEWAERYPDKLELSGFVPPKPVGGRRRWALHAARHGDVTVTFSCAVYVNSRHVGLDGVFRYRQHCNEHGCLVLAGADHVIWPDGLFESVSNTARLITTTKQGVVSRCYK